MQGLQSPRRARRGMSGLGVVVLIAGAALLLGLGYLLGQAGDDREAAPGEVVEPAARTTTAPSEHRADATLVDDADATTDATNDTPQYASASETLAGAPPITFEPATLDLGLVQPNRTITETVQIVNPTDVPLRILATAASCTCTAINLANQIIPARESVPLEITFDTRDRLGVKGSSVRVRIEGYDDPAVINLKANVAVGVFADPTYINAVTDSETNETTLAGLVVVKSQDDEPFRILRTGGKEPSFVDFDPENDAPRNTYTIRWDFTDLNTETCRLSDGRMMPPFWTIETDHPDAPIFDLQVRHLCTLPEPPHPGQNWILSERRVLLGGLEPGEAVEFEVAMKWRGRALPDDRIYSVVSASDAFRTELIDFIPDGREQICKVRLTLTPAAKPGLLYETLYYNAKNADAKLIVIARVLSDDEIRQASAE